MTALPAIQVFYRIMPTSTDKVATVDTMDSSTDEMERVRLTAWARRQGISRITAYRMLKRGILPAPVERSPTGRWYVLLPVKRSGRVAIYSRADPKPNSADIINRQVAALAEWAGANRRIVFDIVRETANPQTGPMPKLERLLADKQISEILIENPSALGTAYRLLVAALIPQGRRIISIK